MKRVFGIVEAVFDAGYLILVFLFGCILLSAELPGNTRILAGLMAIVLFCGDSFHLIPRMRVIASKKEEPFRNALGRGKQITSITMTLFYILLWQVGVSLYSINVNEIWDVIVYVLAMLRIILCLFPQNKWIAQYPPISWGILRNIPFFVMGMVVAALFFEHGQDVIGFRWMWLAIVLSFLFYLPVVIWSNKNPKLGMLMLPKSCMYLWMLVMCLAL